MSTFRPNVRMELVHGAAEVESGADTAAAEEIAIHCPRCGSPYFARPESADSSGSFDGFACAAGDCGFTGSVAKEL